jgi:TolB-like protein
VIREEVSETGGSDLPVEYCRAQLARILSSADFAAADRKHRFLSYVVDEALAGRSSRIKAYSIAVEVFGRDASFDPQTDPIVRVEAGHLRRALERYYLTAGQADPVVISIPKGGYVPSFSLRQTPSQAAEEPTVTAAPASPRPRLPGKPRLIAGAAAILVAVVTALAWLGYSSRVPPNNPDIPRLLVEWFDDLSGTDESAALARGLTQEVIGQLSKFKDIVVVQSPDTATLPQVRYALAGSVDLSADTFRFQVRLLNRADGSVLWAHTYDGGTTVHDLLKAQADVASRVATSLAQTYGAIFEADAKLVVPNPPDDWAAYSCTLSYYSYRAGFDPESRPSVRSCLESAVQRFPGYATAWALLSLVYMDDVRFRFPSDTAESASLVDRALVAADRAVELEPLNVRGLQAQMFALIFKGDMDAAIKVGSRAMAINPNDTVLMGEYGYRLALSGHWNDGCPLVAEARERNPGPLAYYEVALAVCSYFRGDYEQAASWIRKANGQGNALYHLIAAAIFAEESDETDVELQRAWLTQHEPALVTNARQEVLRRLGRPEDAELFLGSLKKAGLEFQN